MRGVTVKIMLFYKLNVNFYSHASCEAWLILFKIAYGNDYFYSHASCEAWLIVILISSVRLRFLLTRLMRGVTVSAWYVEYFSSISTHTPHARRDIINFRKLLTTYNFYSHASCEAWPKKRVISILSTIFLLTRLMRGVTLAKGLINLSLHFYSHASCEAWLQPIYY